MFSSVQKRFNSCWKPLAKKNAEDDDSDRGDGLVWSRDLERHSYGVFSMAVLQANKVLEDQSQVEARKDFTYVGVYDGHGGPDTALRIRNQLFDNLSRLCEQKGFICEEILRACLCESGTTSIYLVQKTAHSKPLIAAVGSACLIGVINGGRIYVSNIGKSRAVMGSSGRFKSIKAIQLTRDESVNYEEVSRAVGDACLKGAEFALGPSCPRSCFPEPITCAVLRSDPAVSCRKLRPEDKFIIFASDGLWDHISNQDAVETVHKYPHAGIARRLVKMALKAAGKKAGIGYESLKLLEKGQRRKYFDDITVAVIFIQHEMLSGDYSVPVVSVRGCDDTVAPSDCGVDTAGPSDTCADAVELSDCGLYRWTVGLSRNLLRQLNRLI